MIYIPELLAHLRATGPSAICFSGGEDSTVLAAHAVEAFGRDSLAIVADIPMLGRRQIRAAVRNAEWMGIRLEIVKLGWEDMPGVSENGGMRCYICKSAMYSAISSKARGLGFSIISAGENADDREEERPGMAAGREFGIRQPLSELGIGKERVRECIGTMALPCIPYKDTCMATRYDPGTWISDDAVVFAEECEHLVRKHSGIGLVRTRISGKSCRVLASPEETHMLLASGDAVISALMGMGFESVSLDEAGYSEKKG